MKKILIIINFILLFLIPIEVFAEETEIDCANNPYACVKCTYDVLKEITITAYSDGKTVNIVEPYINDSGYNPNYAPSYESFIFSKNFEINDNGNSKLKCPAVLYWISRQAGWGVVATLSYDETRFGDKYVIAELVSEDNNNKNIYSSDKKQLSCVYNDHITVTSDGKDIIIENKSGKLLTVSPNNGNSSIAIENNSSKILESFSGAISYTDFVDENGNLRGNCPQYYINCVSTYSCSISNEKKQNSSVMESDESLNGNDIQTARDLIEGRKFINLLGQLKNPLDYGGKNYSNLKLRIGDNENATLSDVTANNLLCSDEECINNNNYYIEQGLTNVIEYCNDVYSKYPNYINTANKSDYESRMRECISFIDFYESGIENNIFSDYRIDCGILSEDLVKKLKWILDIIKIAGPLLALGLGTIDFVKTVASGDADKEMKNTFKHFGIRLIAAALLFLVPFILAFLMDTFLGNQDGYDSDDPFCDIVDWGNIE